MYTKLRVVLNLCCITVFTTYIKFFGWVIFISWVILAVLFQYHERNVGTYPVKFPNQFTTLPRYLGTRTLTNIFDILFINPLTYRRFYRPITNGQWRCTPPPQITHIKMVSNVFSIFTQPTLKFVIFFYFLPFFVQKLSFFKKFKSKISFSINSFRNELHVPY